MKTLLATIALSVLSVPLFAQETDQRLYDGARSIADQKIWLRPWGGGGIAPQGNTVFQGSQSLRVMSRNYFQGGTVNFNNPRDLGRKFDDKSYVLKLTVLIDDGGTVYANADKSRGEGKSNQGLTVVGHAASLNGSNPGDLKIKPAIAFHPKIKKIRFVIQTTDGKHSEAYEPVLMSTSAGDGWRNFAIPLQSITGFDRTNKIIQSITLSSDTISNLFVGDIRITSDTTPIRGTVDSGSLSVPIGSDVTFTAFGDGGDSPLIYSWDFDDRDGIQADGQGQQIRHRFRKPGTFNVTVTISDFYGVKSPAKQTVKVKVAG